MFKKILLTILVLIIIAVAAVPVYFYTRYPRMRAPQEMNAPSDAATLARGKYLVEAMTGCVVCHSPLDTTKPGEFVLSGKEYSGRVFHEEEGFPGTIVAGNISPDPETGIGAWTDGEIVRAIREGVSRDGRPLFPLMNYPSYRDLSDEDVLSIVAYLRTQKPIRNDPGETDLNFPVGMMIRTVPQPLDGPPRGLPAAGIERGRAMLKMMLCGDCHTPRDDRGGPLPGKELAGGNPFRGPWGVVYSANITSHPSAGTGAFSDDDLRRIFREGRNRAGRELWVMPWSITRNLTDADLDALIAALREVPPNPSLVPAPELKTPAPGR